MKEIKQKIKDTLHRAQQQILTKIVCQTPQRKCPCNRNISEGFQKKLASQRKIKTTLKLKSQRAEKKKKREKENQNQNQIKLKSHVSYNLGIKHADRSNMLEMYTKLP